MGAQAENEMKPMKKYEYEGETFKMDDSKGCYVEVTYKDLTGYFGVNISGTETDENPYSYYVGGEEYVTLDWNRHLYDRWPLAAGREAVRSHHRRAVPTGPTDQRPR